MLLDEDPETNWIMTPGDDSLYGKANSMYTSTQALSTSHHAVKDMNKGKWA